MGASRSRASADLHLHAVRPHKPSLMTVHVLSARAGCKFADQVQKHFCCGAMLVCMPSLHFVVTVMLQG